MSQRDERVGQIRDDALRAAVASGGTALISGETWTFYILIPGSVPWACSVIAAPRYRAYADRAAEVGGTLVDIVTNIWVAKAFSAHSRERGRFAQPLETEASAHRGSLMYIEAMRVLHDLGLWLMAVGMLVWTLVLWSRGSVTPGDVILTLAVAFRVLHGSRDLAFAVVDASQFVARIAEAIQLIGEDH
jgi:ATP-binding cassette subfamily B protein